METCSTPPTPAVTGGRLEWGGGGARRSGKCKGEKRREDGSRAELQAERKLVCLQMLLCNRVG